MDPVIWDFLDNRQSGTAVRTVDERISIPPVPRIKKFPETIVANSDIRRDMDCPPLALFAEDDTKFLFMKNVDFIGDETG